MPIQALQTHAGTAKRRAAPSSNLSNDSPIGPRLLRTRFNRLLRARHFILGWS